MIKNLIDALRRKSTSLADLPDTIHVPAHGGKHAVDGMHIEDTSIDDLVFAIQGLEVKHAQLVWQLESLRRLHKLARERGAVGTDIVSEIFSGEV